MDDVFQANEIPPMGPTLAAMHAARSALTVAGGRGSLWRSGTPSARTRFR